MTEDKSLTVVQNDTNSLEAYVNNINQKLAFCDMLLKGSMVPATFKTPQAVLSAILYGQELGFSPVQALNSVFVVNGKPTLESHAIKALMIQNGAVIKTVKHDATECILEISRGNWTERFDFHIDTAKAAGLLGKDIWKNYPKDMLYARAVSRGGRNMFADKLKGFYGREEMEDAQVVLPADPKPAKKEQPIKDIQDVLQTEYRFSYDLAAIPEDVKKDAKKLLKAANGKRDEADANKIWTTSIIPDLESWIVDYPEPASLRDEGNEPAIIPDNAEVQQ